MSILYQKTNSKLDPIEIMINAKLFQLNTMFPAEVEALSLPNVSVKPLIKSFYADNLGNIKQTDLPVIENIPVMCFGSTSSNVANSVSVGDKGIVFIAQGDIEPVYQSSTTYSHRKFDILDGIFVPLVKSSLTDEGTLKLTAPKIILDAGKFAVQNSSGELIAVLVAVLQAINALVTTDSATLNPATQSAINAQITKLETFIG